MNQQLQPEQGYAVVMQSRTEYLQLKGVVLHFRKYAYSLPCRELDGKINISLMM